MAKTRMMCPFSNRLCEECALYRGRHYYLCFCKKYRGYLEELKEFNKFSNQGANSNKRFEMPAIKPRSAIDPFAIIMKELGKEV